MEALTMELPSDAETPLQVRRSLSGILPEWVDDETRARALLLASELVTNAVRHGGDSSRVTLSCDSDEVRVAVADTNTALPRVLAPDPEHQGGLGMWLIEHLADEWGVDPGPDGKVVWFVVRATHRSLTN
jgi:anti-sigma regulatory factor (Ser/Thr protein kinase)